MSTPARYCPNCRQMVQPSPRAGFATGWLIVLAAIIVSVPLALAFDVIPHEITGSIAGACSLAIVVVTLKYSALVQCARCKGGSLSQNPPTA